ncbi:CatB-related O-acetyltransferase [Gluconobacter oxydans]|uniref:CatB-related O-acetyltransferase n=1 Tax=Gluconobacter oxydans TaxID=442 RepID=UPI0018C869F7|nr:CatB-related O-acetyltransferase [Gluconobacter oxydans]
MTVHIKDRFHIITGHNPEAFGELKIENPSHYFEGFTVYGNAKFGAFSYSFSRITPSVSSIGRYCSVAAGVEFGFAEHPVSWLSTSSFTYEAGFSSYHPGEPFGFSSLQAKPLPAEKKRDKIVIGNDVWIGAKSYIRNGVILGDGCIVGAYSVVTKDVPPYAIVVGNPARIVKFRFPEQTIARLLATRWWDYDFRDFSSVDVTDIDASIDRIAHLIENGMKRYTPLVAIYRGEGKNFTVESVENEIDEHD